MCASPADYSHDRITDIILLYVSEPSDLRIATAGPSLTGALATTAPGTDPLTRLVAAWLAGYSSTRTRKAYGRDVERFTAWLAEHRVHPLDAARAHVDLYARQLEHDGAADSTIARALSSLSSFYAYAVDEDVIARNPVTRVRRPRVSPDDTATVGLSRDDARQLLEVARADGQRSHALVTLLLTNGLRVGEALGADVTGLGTARGHRTLSVRRKAGKRATVPLAPSTVEAVEAYIGDRVEGPLFVTSSGRRMDEPAVFRLVRRLARQAGVAAAEQVSPHSLRHAAVTAALDAGVALRDVQDFAGHADPRTTRRYDRARHSLDRHATYAVASYLAG